MTSGAKPESQRIIDMHVHVVGNGSGGSGCWYRSTWWRWPLETFMAWHIGLPWRAFRGDLETAYTATLLGMVRTSSLDAIVILAQDHPYDEEGRILGGTGSFYVPNDYVLGLADRHPEFLPAVSIHPARKDALEELDRCLERGAVMMKCLPNCHNIDCSSRRYTAFWERMAEAKIPLLAHTGGEHTLPVVRREFADPRYLEWPLQCGVTVIAAHCGTKSGLFDPQYFSIFAEMTERHANLYGDLSAFNVPIRGQVVPHCLKEPLVHRMIHGSDFPVPVLGHWSWLKGYVDWRTFRRWERQPNVLERDYQLKRGMGFPPETFTRINRLLPGP